MIIEFKSYFQKDWKNKVEIAEKYIRDLSKGDKSFTVDIKINEGKTHLQLAGIYRIIELYAKRLEEINGYKFSTESAKQMFKYEFGLLRPRTKDEATVEAFILKKEKELDGGKVSQKRFNFYVEEIIKNHPIPMSLADLTKEQAQQLISDIHSKWVLERGWTEMVLIPEHYRALMDKFN